MIYLVELIPLENEKIISHSIMFFTNYSGAAQEKKGRDGSADKTDGRI